MDLIFIDWDCCGREDILDAFKKLNYSVVLFPKITEDETRFHRKYIEELRKEIVKQKIQFVFSINYFHSISEACNEEHIPYISWVYDNPFMRLHCINIINECNYIFTFNRYTYHDLKKRGVETVYYAPLAANAKRLSKLCLSDWERKELGADISFVGRMYNDTEKKGDLCQIVWELLKKSNCQRTLGYIDSVCEVQLGIYGKNFLKDSLDKNVISDIRRIYQSGDEDLEFFYFTDFPYLCASYILSRRVTQMERKKMLASLSRHFETKVFTYDENAELGNCRISGWVNPFDVAPKVFKASKINLNITLRSIETGIPLRAFEVMGAGGFLLSNYQEDFLLHFEPDKDFVFYESEEDLIEKSRFYLKHDSLRKKIAASGFEKVAKEHTFEKRIDQMFRIALKKVGD